MICRGHNIFQIKNKSKEVEDMYYSPPLSPISPTQQKLMKHFGSSLDNRVSYAISKEVDKLKAPISQYTMDVYHQSGAISWPIFVNNSTMNNLSRHNHNTFTILHNYQTQFTKNIYASLSQYLLSIKRYYKGCAMDLLQHISAIYNYLLLFDIPSHACMQIDFRSIHHLIHSNSSNDDGELKYNEDDIHGFDYQIADDKHSAIITDEDPMPCMNKMKSFDLNVDKNINHILRQCIVPFAIDDNICKYKRYELLLKGKDIKLFEAKVNNNIPNIDCIKNAPLCLIFNSISSAQQMINKLCDKNTSLINVSFQKYSDTIAVYIYIVDDNGKLFGSKITKDDLLTKIPLLFQHSMIYKLENMQFKHDERYRKYYLSLLQNTNQTEQKESMEYNLDPIFLSDLEQIITHLNTNKAKTKQINIETVKTCFRENNIHYNYFRTHKKKHFRQLLQKYNIKAAASLKIYNAFTKNQSNPSQQQQCINNENEIKIQSNTNDNILQMQMQHQQYLEYQYQMDQDKIQRLENEVRILRQENNDLKRTINSSMDDNDTDHKNEPVDMTQHIHMYGDIYASLISENAPAYRPFPARRELNKFDTRNDIGMNLRELQYLLQKLQHYWHFERAYFTQLVVSNHSVQNMQQVSCVLWILYLFNRCKKEGVFDNMLNR